MLQWYKVIRSYTAIAATLFMAGCSALPVSATPQPTHPTLHPTLPASERITASATTPDGSYWYSFDEFDGIGGISPYAQHRGLFRSKNGVISHFVISETIRVLAVAPDGSLYAGVGCGVLRFQSEQWLTLAEPDCQHSAFTHPLFPFDIAFSPQGNIWVGGVHGLARFDSHLRKWTEYAVKARRLLIAPDGSVWTEGWDGVANSDCCYTHLIGNTWVTYTHSAKLPVPEELSIRIDKLKH